MTIDTSERRTIYAAPRLLNERSTHYCPGCGHGVVQRLIAEVLGELGLGPRTIAVGPVGCAVFAYDYLDLDFIEAPHGRAPAVATGVRRVRPDAFVLTYQGDGDLAAIGTGEIVHTAARGESITAIFVNNGIYGMTGGQMAPTTLIGQRTTSSPAGREVGLHGYPVPMTEMLAILPGVAYAARGSVADAGSIGKTKAYIRRACEAQLAGAGFAIVEVISNCPVGWGMTPTQSIEHLRDVVSHVYQPGVLVDRLRTAAPAGALHPTPTARPHRPEAAAATRPSTTRPEIDPGRTTSTSRAAERAPDGTGGAGARRGEAPRPPGEAPAGDAPAGDAPAGDAPAGDAPAGDAPAPDASSGSEG
jgi:2-oxoglutarate ferredoxin oxidoreductase subunit beta